MFSALTAYFSRRNIPVLSVLLSLLLSGLLGETLLKLALEILFASLLATPPRIYGCRLNPWSVLRNEVRSLRAESSYALLISASRPSLSSEKPKALDRSK